MSSYTAIMFGVAAAELVLLIRRAMHRRKLRRVLPMGELWPLFLAAANGREPDSISPDQGGVQGTVVTGVSPALAPVMTEIDARLVVGSPDADATDTAPPRRLTGVGRVREQVTL